MSGKMSLWSALVLCLASSVWAVLPDPGDGWVDAALITVTSSYCRYPDMGPGKTIDGSGLSADLKHSTNSWDLWTCYVDDGRWGQYYPPYSYSLSPSGLRTDGWIQFEFSTPQEIGQVWVWNYNDASHTSRGFRYVAVDYSVDGTTWTRLGGGDTYLEFAKATGTSDYECNNKIDLGGVAVKKVVLTSQFGDKNWGDPSNIGLSEVLFRKPSYTAEAPSPASGSLANVDTDLSWTAGLLAATHDVYFGTDQAAVTSATRANPQGVLVSQGQASASYTALPALTPGTTYYWRIDEISSDGLTIWPGFVWNFTTYYEDTEGWINGNNILVQVSSEIGDMPGVRTIDGSGLSTDLLHNNDTLNLWTTYYNIGGNVPSPSGSTGQAWIAYDFGNVYEINQMWVWNYNPSSAPQAGRGFKNVNIDYSADGVNWIRLMDGANNYFVFTQAPGTSGYACDIKINFGGVQAKQVVLTAQNNFGYDDYYGLSEVRFKIPAPYATGPNPADTAGDVPSDGVLSWTAGDFATSHDVYLGTDQAAVTSATRANPQGVLVSQGQAAASYTPSNLNLNTTYYWRIDEVNPTYPESPWKGTVWSFTVANYLSVDDFEYASPADFSVWTPATNITLDTTIVHGVQGASMRLDYNNASGQQTAVGRSTPFTNWTVKNVKSLTVYFRGTLGNSAENLFVRLNSGAASSTVNYPTSANLAQESWIEWNIDLAQFAGINLTNVTAVTVGVSDLGANGGAGTIYIDDLRLYPIRCVPSLMTYPGDFNNDCLVNLGDMALMAGQWLVEQEVITGVAPNSAGLLGWWKFDAGSGSVAVDSSGKNNNGTIYDALWVNDPQRGWCLDFDAYGFVDVPGSALSTLNRQVTVAFWQYGDPVLQPRDNRAFEAANASNEPILSCWLPWSNGYVYWDAGGEPYISGGERIFVGPDPTDPDFGFQDESSYEGQWNHWVFTKSVDDTLMQIYLNGVVIKDSSQGFTPGDGTKTMEGITSFSIGADRFGLLNYAGKLSDFRVYNYLLSQEEIVYIMTNGGSLTRPLRSEAAILDLVEDGVINISDLIEVAENWLQEQLFPSL